MNYSFRELLEDRFRTVIRKAACTHIAEDNTSGLPAQVRTVQLKHLNLNVLLQCEDYIEFPAVLSVGVSSYDDGANYLHYIDVCCTISGTFSKYFDDFRIYGLRTLKNAPRYFNTAYTEDLLPCMTREQMELQARQLLEKVYDRYYELGSMPKIDPVDIAKALGIRIYFVRLSENADVRGMYVMEDSEVLIYDDKLKMPKYCKVKGKTILLERNIRGNKEIIRFTIMHELIHAYVQRFTFYMMAISRREFFTLRCPIRVNDEQQFLNAFLEKVERQADAIAAYALMPKEIFEKRAIEIQSQYGAMRDSACMKEMVDKVAAEFEVSVSAARRRLLELGFHDVKGVYQFMDGKYIPPFSFKKDSLQTNQTYSISEGWAKKLLASDKKLLKMVAKGVICFVENHFILNDPNYLTADKKLTDYGREHLHECALKFNLVYPDKRCLAHRSDEKVAFRSIEATSPLNILYSDDNADIEEQARQLCKRNTAVMELVKSMPEDFGDSLTHVVKWTQKTREQIANDCWMSEKTIYRLCNNVTENPSVSVVVQLCIGMDLPFEVSMKLIERAGYRPRNTLRDMAIMQLLILSYRYSIEDCNKILIAQGLEPLVAKNPAA